MCAHVRVGRCWHVRSHRCKWSHLSINTSSSLTVEVEQTQKVFPLDGGVAGERENVGLLCGLMEGKGRGRDWESREGEKERVKYLDSD